MDFATQNGNINCNAFDLDSGKKVSVQLRWGNDDWGGADIDLDVRMYGYDGSSYSIQSASATDHQSGGSGDIPFESFAYTAPNDGGYCLQVKHHSGSVPDWVQLQMWTVDDLAIFSDSGSITNPGESTNDGMLTVGAANYRHIDTIENFSSRGPTPGGAIKPDIAGADAGHSDVFGGDFPGTSQASPHVAGLIALLRGRFDYLNPTPAEHATLLKALAIPRTDTSPNNTWGTGFAALPQEPWTPEQLAATPGHQQVQLSWHDAHDSSITKHQYSTDGGHHWSDIHNSGHGQVHYTSFTVTGLNNGTGYTLGVRAVNSHGIGNIAFVYATPN